MRRQNPSSVGFVPVVLLALFAACDAAGAPGAAGGGLSFLADRDFPEGDVLPEGYEDREYIGGIHRDSLDYSTYGRENLEEHFAETKEILTTYGRGGTLEGTTWQLTEDSDEVQALKRAYQRTSDPDAWRQARLIFGADSIRTIHPSGEIWEHHYRVDGNRLRSTYYRSGVGGRTFETLFSVSGDTLYIWSQGASDSNPWIRPEDFEGSVFHFSNLFLDKVLVRAVE